LVSHVNGGQYDFRSTQWSVVLAARNAPTEVSRAALEKLCRGYWLPVYTFIRRRGASRDDAQDLTQGFFARMLEKEWLQAADSQKGRFRTFLLTAATRFLANEYDHAQALKRGGGQVILSLQWGDAEQRIQFEPADERSPEVAYDQQWAETLLERVLERLRDEFDGAGKQRRFDALKSFLTEDRGATTYAEVAARLDLSESAVKSGVYRLRRRYGELVRDEIAQTVTSAEAVEDEIRYLLDVLAQ
jgi:RNA polymerase sigma-70 factor (ECF subfamily)